MAAQDDLERIRQIPFWGPMWAESIENWLCVTDALRMAQPLPEQTTVARSAAPVARIVPAAEVAQQAAA